MPLHNIQHLIDSSTELRTVHKKARQHATLQQVLVDYTPAELALASRVGYIKAGTLFLLADHAAVAAKLRQLLPRLLPKFSKLEPQVTGIKVVVQVKISRQVLQGNVRKSVLSEDAIMHFKTLSHTVSDPGLKSAITNLVLRRPKTSN